VHDPAEKVNSIEASISRETKKKEYSRQVYKEAASEGGLGA
jgi:hypothetical protein